MSTSIRRFVMGVTLVALSVAPMPSGAQAPGVLTGIVTDSSNQSLPGVKVTATSGSVQTSAITDENGRYEIRLTTAGAYKVIAELSGFETATAGNVLIAMGATANLPLVLQLGCLSDVLFVDMGIGHALQEAALVAHIRVLRSDPARSCRETGMCVCTDHVVEVTEIVKADRRTPAPTLRIVQAGAGRVEELQLWGDRPYAVGEEYIAFLQWSEKGGFFYRTDDDGYTLPVRDGRVEFQRDNVPGLPNGMRVEEFISALRGLVKP